MPISYPITGNYVGTNNVNAVDNSVNNHSRTYNYPVPKSSRGSFVFGAKSLFPSVKDLLDQVLAELRFISEQDYDEDQCNDFVTTHEQVSTRYYQLKEDVQKGFFWSFSNFSRVKELKKDAKSMHTTVMRASEAARREMARPRKTQRMTQQSESQRPPSNLPPSEPCHHPCSTHTSQPPIVFNLNLYVLP
ncbi:hypothetical protein AB1N83_013415 [Pleurotus pulmonarius]